MQGPTKVTKGELSEVTTVKFDTGCQWFTGQDPMFLEELKDWRTIGSVAEWHSPRVGSWTEAGSFEAIPQEQLPQIFAGVGGMASIADTLLEEIGEDNMTYAVARRFTSNLQTGKYSLTVEVDKAHSHLSFIGGNLPMPSESRELEDQFDYVVMAQGLAAKQPRMVEFENSTAQQVVHFLCDNLRYQTLMVLTMVFRKPLPLPFDICRPNANTHIGLVVRASGKPGMYRDQFETWTICASAEFAREYALPKAKNIGLQVLQNAFFFKPST
jgi:predicted NAD/FAD-dependent oxidoreductase